MRVSRKQGLQGRGRGSSESTDAKKAGGASSDRSLDLTTRRHGFNPWSGKISHASEQLSL